MSDISLSKAVRSNLLSLQNTSAMMAKTQERLATGNKVNSALDNPTNFFTASGLNSRAGDLNSLMDGMANGIQTLQAADNGLKSITKTLESMQSTLRQARQDKSFQTKSFTLDADAIQGTAGQTRELTFAGGAFAGAESISLTKETKQTVVGEAYTAPAASTGATTAATTAWGATRDLSAATIDFNLVVNGDAANPITVSLGGGSAATTITQARDAINTELSDTTIRARLNGAGTHLEFYDTDPANVGTGNSITVTGSATTDTLGLTTGGVNNTGTPGTTGTSVVTVNGHQVTLNGDDHKTADAAATEINRVLRAEGAPAGLRAVADNGALSVIGPDNNAGVTLGGPQVNAVFGAGRETVAASAAGDASGPVKSVDELVSEINSKKNADGSDNALYGKIRASNDNGKLRIENLSTQELDIDGVSTDGAVDGTSTGASEILGNSVRASLADQFNELRDQLDKLSDDASFNGINLLRGDKLTITFNETGTSSIDIQTKGEKSVDSSSLGVPTTLSESDMDSDTAIDNFLSQIKTALNDVRSQSSSFGSNLSIVQNRQDFTKNMINTLQTGAANLTLADMNEEAANLLALQTRQSLSSSSLSLASQADQSVLQLIR